MRLRRLRIACGGILFALLCGCTTLPDSGDVHTRPTGPSGPTNQAADFKPPGPVTDDTPSGIVRGFLVAMQANPPSVAVARSFLSARAKGTWKPTEGTIVYQDSTLEGSVDSVTARLRDAHRLSRNGVWLDGTDASTTALSLTLVQEDGQWRIDNPPNALAVRASYFSTLFAGFDLYFFDRTGTVLVPTRVYLPEGQETATNLVRGLVAGPPPAQRDVAMTALPSQPDADVAVVVNRAGVADVPLGSTVLNLSAADLNRLVVQLTWTLRQVPGINRVRVTADGVPVPLANGRTDVSVREGDAYDPLVASRRDLLAISGGRVLLDDADHGQPVGGPFGEPGFALRSLAWNARGRVIAAVTANGRKVLVAPDRGSRATNRVHSVLDRGTDVLRPSYDRFGGLWLIDRTAEGAVVHLVRNDRDHVIQVQGISGRRISAFTLTNDGSALVAAVAGSASPTLEVSMLVRDVNGRLERATPTRTLHASGADLGPARDVAQNSATSVAVLTQPATGPQQIVFMELDGSPGPAFPEDEQPPQTVPGEIETLMASPDPTLSLRAVTTDRRLFRLDGTGQWVPSALQDIATATYAQ
jgi:hypothetical protein